VHRIVATVLGIVVGLLAIIGFFVEGEHLLGIMNVDLTLDILRLLIAVALLVVGLAPQVPAQATKAVIIVVGAMYVLMGLLAFADPTLFGLLPTGFTGFDIAFHLIVGIAALVIAFVPQRVVEGAASGNRRS
jgi:hypothetical protein